MTDEQRDLRYVSNGEFQIAWNKFATSAAKLSDEELTERINSLKRAIANLRVELEATGTEAERRDGLKRQSQFESDVQYKPLPNYDEETKKDAKHSRQKKSAVDKLTALGIGEGAAKAMMVKMLAEAKAREEAKK